MRRPPPMAPYPKAPRKNILFFNCTLPVISVTFVPVSLYFSLELGFPKLASRPDALWLQIVSPWLNHSEILRSTCAIEEDGAPGTSAPAESGLYHARHAHIAQSRHRNGIIGEPLPYHPGQRRVRMTARLRIPAGTARPLIPYLSGMVNNFLGPGRIYRLPLRGVRSRTTERIRPTQTGLPILYAGVPRPYRRKKFPRAFLRETVPRKVRAASEIFACLFAFDPLGSALKDILTGFSPNSAERFPTIN
ncbi:MAG: hypothetical protein LZF62_70001 [Nitrospira sp.]|nr:MAG: hypothetical protein LZF62_70001 [Nitrospira sp.]